MIDEIKDSIGDKLFFITYVDGKVVNKMLRPITGDDVMSSTAKELAFHAFNLDANEHVTVEVTDINGDKKFGITFKKDF